MPQVGDKANTRATQAELDRLVRNGIGGAKARRPRPSKRKTAIRQAATVLATAGIMTGLMACSLPAPDQRACVVRSGVAVVPCDAYVVTR